MNTFGSPLGVVGYTLDCHEIEAVSWLQLMNVGVAKIVVCDMSLCSLKTKPKATNNLEVSCIYSK